MVMQLLDTDDYTENKKIKKSFERLLICGCDEGCGCQFSDSVKEEMKELKIK